MEALARRAVEAAHAAGAQYADARLTRVVQEHYWPRGALAGESEILGVGVRAVVNGYWGFSASAIWEPDEMVRLGREVVAQARENAFGTPRRVDLGTVPVVTGSWATPIRIDPFTISIEEKSDTLRYWDYCVNQLGEGFAMNPNSNGLHFTRQERVLATSEGTCVTQTTYESGGQLIVDRIDPQKRPLWSRFIEGIATRGKGWELFLDAKILDQLDRMKAEDVAYAQSLRGGRPAAVGRYTIVCDGVAMASILERTIGLATQLDRALGYEANAGGTSYIDDPLSALGTLQVASPLVTVTANRSAPAQLATVRWDDEGVVPESCTLVSKGVLHDLQTTREQAAWLAPYYSKHGRPVRSHGHAAAEDALYITMQHMPNLAMEPNPSAVGLDDLVASVKDGILITGGRVVTDHQARNGLLYLGDGDIMRRIVNGKVKGPVVGGYIEFNTADLWRHVVAVGGIATQGEIASSPYNLLGIHLPTFSPTKGQPIQSASHSVCAVAATITNQAMINVMAKV